MWHGLVAYMQSRADQAYLKNMCKRYMQLMNFLVIVSLVTELLVWPICGGRVIILSWHREKRKANMILARWPPFVPSGLILKWVFFWTRIIIHQNEFIGILLKLPLLAPFDEENAI